MASLRNNDSARAISYNTRATRVSTASASLDAMSDAPQYFDAFAYGPQGYGDNNDNNASSAAIASLQSSHSHSAQQQLHSHSASSPGSAAPSGSYRYASSHSRGGSYSGQSPRGQVQGQYAGTNTTTLEHLPPLQSQPRDLRAMQPPLGAAPYGGYPGSMYDYAEQYISPPNSTHPANPSPPILPFQAQTAPASGNYPLPSPTSFTGSNFDLDRYGQSQGQGSGTGMGHGQSGPSRPSHAHAARGSGGGSMDWSARMQGMMQSGSPSQSQSQSYQGPGRSFTPTGIRAGAGTPSDTGSGQGKGKSKQGPVWVKDEEQGGRQASGSVPGLMGPPTGQGGHIERDMLLVRPGSLFDWAA